MTDPCYRLLVRCARNVVRYLHGRRFVTVEDLVDYAWLRAVHGRDDEGLAISQELVMKIMWEHARYLITGMHDYKNRQKKHHVSVRRVDFTRLDRFGHLPQYDQPAYRVSDGFVRALAVADIIESIPDPAVTRVLDLLAQGQKLTPLTQTLHLNRSWMTDKLRCLCAALQEP